MPGGDADSAGFPWAGRTFDHHETAFAGDAGAAPAELREAVRSLRAAAYTLRQAQGATGSGHALSLSKTVCPPEIDALAAAHVDALLALAGSRVLVPLLAEAGELGLTPEGKLVEKTQELSIVTVAGPDGRRVMPVFSSVDAMRAWNPTARPIPVPMPQAALAAAQDQTDLIIVDPGTPGSELGVRRTQLEAVALGRRVSPPWADAAAVHAFEAAFGGDARVLGVRLAPGDPEARLLAPETDVLLSLQPGLDRDALGALLADAQQRWATSEVIAERVDSLRIALH